MSAVVLLRKLSHIRPASAVILTTTKNAQLLSLSVSNKYYSENRRNMSGFLIDEPKYAFLKELGIEKRNHGVFNGTWGGSGDVSQFLVYFLFVYFFSQSRQNSKFREFSSQGKVINQMCCCHLVVAFRWLF